MNYRCTRCGYWGAPYAAGLCFNCLKFDNYGFGSGRRDYSNVGMELYELTTRVQQLESKLNGIPSPWSLVKDLVKK